MSDQQTPEEDIIDQDPLIEKVSEEVSTDIIMDLKTGIYNLFVSLMNNLIVEKGFEGAIRESTDFIDEISINFKQIITNPASEEQ